MRLYAAFREPKVFLTILCGFITMSLTEHVMRSYDVDLGLTNLILSIEASVYGVISSMMTKTVLRKQDEMAATQQKQLDAVLEMTAAQDKTLKGVLLIAEAQRDMLIDQSSLLRALREGDERILKTLTGGGS